MGLEVLAAVEGLLAGSAVPALAAAPTCAPVRSNQMLPSLGVERLGDRVLAVRVLRAVDAAAGQQAGEIGDADAEDLLGQDVVDALFEVGNLVLEPFVRRLVISRRNTPDFVTRVEERDRLVGPDVRAVVVVCPASASVSSIWLANSGGVKTSSLERFAMQVSTSGLRPRSAKPRPASVTRRAPSTVSGG